LLFLAYLGEEGKIIKHERFIHTRVDDELERRF
jgi:hypothetical protein